MRFPVNLLTRALLAAPLATPALAGADLQPVGAVATVAKSAQGLQLACADGSTVTVAVLAPDLIRVRMLFAGQPPAPDRSWAVARTDWPAVPWQLAESPAAVTLITDELKVVVNRDPLLIEFRDARTDRRINADARPMARDPKSGRIAAGKVLGFDEHFYGLGEKAAHLDRRRGRFELWNSDTPGYLEGTDPIYQSIPFYLGVEAGRAYGLFYDNVFALDPYDLAVVKLMVGREKDLDLLRAMLRLEIVKSERLRQHYQQTPLGEREAVTAGRNLTLLLRELGCP